MSRVVRIVAMTLAVLFVVVMLPLAWVLYSESGTRFALGQVRGLLPEGIGLGAVSGRLGNHLVVEDLVVDQPGMRLVVERAWLRWSALALGDAEFSVEELGAEGITYTAREAEQPPPAGEPFRLPEEVSLPLAVYLEQLTVTDVEVRLAAEAEPLLIDRLAASQLSFVDSQLDLAALELRAPLLSLDASAQATAAGDYPLQADLDWTAKLEGYAPLEGTTTLSGSLASLQIGQRLATPYNLQLSGTVADAVNPDAPLTLDAQLGVEEMRLSAVAETLPAATISLDATVDGPVDALEVRLDAAGSDPQQRRFAASLAALVEGQAITIRDLSIRQPEREGRLTGSGSVALAGGVEADLHIEWSALTWPLTGEAMVHSPRGTIDVAGPLEDYRLTLNADLEPVDAPAVVLTVAGSGSLEAADLELDAQTQSGRVQGDVELSWADAVTAQTRLEVTDLNPAVVAPDWPGAVDFQLTASGRMADERIDAEVTRLEADGRLREQPLSVAAVARYQQRDGAHLVVVDNLDARFGPTRVNVEGRVGDRADLRWQMRSDDLSTLLPGLAGALSGSGSVSGPLPQATVAAELDGRDLAYDGNQLAELSLRADVDLAGEARSTLTLEAREAVLAGTSIAELSLTGSGTAASHQARLAVAAEAGSGALALEGRLQDPWGSQPLWHYAFSDGEIAYRDLPTWELRRSEEGVVGAGRQRVGRQCWAAAQASLCLGAQRDGGDVSGELDLADLQFTQLAALLPEGFQPEGAVDAQATFSYADQGPIAARVAIEAPQGRLRGEAQLAPAAAAADAGTVVPLDNRPVEASLSIDVPDLGFVSALAAGVEDMQGRIDGELQMSGSLADPDIAGSVNLRNGQVGVPQPGLTLTDLSVSLEGRGRGGLGLSASAVSGGGDLRLDGTLSPLGEAPTANLTISGQEFMVVDNADARMYLSPDLRIDAGIERIDIRGDVHVPRAEITPGTSAPSAVTVSEDQVLVSEQEEDTATTRPIHAEVRITLGEEVRFEGFGLTAELDGGVEVRQQPETPVTATGEIIIEEGEYRAYGQGLVIEGGRIYFAGGPITQPALDIRAVRRPQEGILVGADVGGTLEEPTFELFSEPTMTQQEQLSWLVLGRSLEETPDGQESALNQAVLAMGLKGGDFLAQNIGQQIGLDEIGVQTGSGEAGGPSDPGNAALVVGKYLSPKLYVSYGIGLFDPESVLKLQYEISRNWRVVTESSGEATGADLLYNIEVGN